jgi:hypothetical protein
VRVSPAYIIILDDATPSLREGVQDLIKQHTENWWHRLPDVWIVEGGGAPSAWRDRIRPLLVAAGAETTSALVLRLPEADGIRGWASYGPGGKERMKWLRENYSGDEDG